MEKLFFIIFSVVLFFACQKENIDNTMETVDRRTILDIRPLTLDSVEVTDDGALNFLSESAYYRIIDTLTKCSQKQLDIWEESIVFKSMRRSVNEIVESSFFIPSIKSNNEIVEENSSIVKLERGNIKPIISASFYRNIINNDGIFYLKGQKYEVTENYVKFPISYYDSIANKLISEDVVFLYNKEEVTTKAPAANELGKRSGSYHNVWALMSGSSDELWIETKYKLYGNLIGNAMLIPGPISKRYLVRVRYYLQIDSWLWKTDFSQSRWSYYKPTFHLYFKDINFKLNTSHVTIEKKYGNPIGYDNEYYFSWTEDIGSYESEVICVISFVSGKVSTVEEEARKAGYFEYINYKAGCSDNNSTVNVSFRAN